MGVVWAQDAFAGGQGLFVQGDRLIEAPRVPVGDGEVVPRLQDVGVVRAQDAFAGGQSLFVQGARLIEAPWVSPPSVERSS